MTYVETRDKGLLDRFDFDNDSRVSLYEFVVDSYEDELFEYEEMSYSIYMEQDAMEEKARYEHMVFIEFPTLEKAKVTFEALKLSSMTCIMSPATAT